MLENKQRAVNKIRWVLTVWMCVWGYVLGYGMGMFFLFHARDADARRGQSSELYLDETRVRVYWNDGDSFRVLGGSRRGRLKARLMQFNTLENHGPVHRWGTWKAQELQKISWEATRVARQGHWHCQTIGSRDAYQRALVKCHDLAKALISRGLAHVYSVRGPGDAGLLRLQRQAQQRKVGMWAKGVPPYLLTSLHSARERRSSTYNRLISTQTGASKKDRHSREYRTCQWVCTEGSCMLYVPFKKRYGRRRAWCLRRNAPEEDGGSDLE